jgi:hypothetical protein
MNSLHDPWILRNRQNVTWHADKVYSTYMGTIVRCGHLVTQTTASLENYCSLFSAHFQYSNAGGYTQHTGLFFP